MISKKLKFVPILLATTWLAGCATNPTDIALPANYLSHSKHYVALQMTAPPSASCLLTGGFHGPIDASLDKILMYRTTASINTINPAVYRALQQSITHELMKKNINIVSSNKALPTANVDTLLITFDQVGISRNYAGWLPGDVPKAYVSMTGTLTSTTNEVLWRYHVSVQEPINGEWYQPPTYPNLKTAYVAALKIAGETLLTNISLKTNIR